MRILVIHVDEIVPLARRTRPGAGFKWSERSRGHTP